MKIYAQRLAGLGNQLFVAAAGHHFAEKKSGEVILLAPRDFNPHSKADYAQSIFRRFQHARDAPASREVREVANCEDLVIPEGDEDIRLIGYFQRASLVSDAFCALLHLPPPSLLPTNDQFSLVLHLRGGDYTRPPWSFWHLIDIQEYLRKARAQFPHLFERLILIFTNDPFYAAKTMQDAGLYYQMVLAPPDASELQSLADMAAGDVPLMISNSSFSWWAARLSKKERMKILPRNWFPSEEKSREWDCLHLAEAILV